MFSLSVKVDLCDVKVAATKPQTGEWHTTIINYLHRFDMIYCNTVLAAYPTHTHRTLLHQKQHKYLAPSYCFRMGLECVKWGTLLGAQAQGGVIHSRTFC